MNSAPRSPAPPPPNESPVPALSPLSPTGTSTVAVPPKGPGVVVPFPAPPRDTDKSRLALSIIGGVTAFVLVCGGALASAVGILVWANQELVNQSIDVAEEFMDEIVAQDYDGAHRLLCEDKRDILPRKEFAKQWSELGIVYGEPVELRGDEQDLVVVTEVELPGGVTTNIDLTVVLEEQTMEMAVCDWDDVQ